MKPFRRLPSASVVPMLLALATPVAAQTENAEPAQTTSSEVGSVPVEVGEQAAPLQQPDSNTPNTPVFLEEVIVTARKREEPLQDVPVSISAFSGAQLDARGVVDVRDLAQAVPGLQFSDLGGYNLIYLRGIGTDIFIPSAEPSVATYLDGVYFPSGHSIAQSFGAIERIEVLKGPQGTLFGRNSTGGAIAIFSEQPGPETTGSLQTSYGNFGDTRTRGHLNLALGEGFATSVSAFYNRRDSYYDWDNANGDELPSEINKGARLRAALEFTDNLKLTLTGLAAQSRGTSTTVAANVDPTGFLGATLPAETRDYVITANSQPKLTTDTYAYYGQFDWNHPGVDIKLLGSFYKVRAYDYVYDFDGTSQPIATYGADSEFQRFTTSELQFTSNDESWGSDWFKWVGGLYYLKSRGGYDPGYLRLLDFVQLPIDNLVGALPEPVRGPLDALLGGLPDSLTFYFTGLLDTESYSAYAQSTMSLTDWFDVTLGGRWQHETRELVMSRVDVGTPDASINYSFNPAKTSANNFSPKVSLDFRPVKDVLLYTSFQQGYKSGTYNIINIFAQPEYVKPERVTSYELGLKSDWFKRTLRFNAALFQNDIKNLQSGFMSFTSGGAVNLENAGKARIRGAEIELAWQPLPSLDPGLTLGGNASWLKAKYRDYTNARGFCERDGEVENQPESCNSLPDGLAYDNGDFSGNRIVRTPKFSGNFTLSQSFEIPGGPIEIAGDYYYNSGYYYLAQNTPNTFEDAFDIINARISYLYRPWSLRATAFGANLGDERYNLAQFHTDFGRHDSLAPPRTWGLRLNWDF